MKYFKYIDGDYPSFTLNKIYPENSHGEGSSEYPIVMYNAFSSENFQEVSEEEYLKQEGKTEEFILPEKWCVLNPENDKSQLLYDYVNSLEESKNGMSYPYSQGSYFHFPMPRKNIRTSSAVRKNYTEITFEQFEKHVLNNNKQMGRKKIGYKLIRPGYNKAACAIEGYKHTGWNNIEGRIFTFADHNEAISAWRGAGVLDLWFEPVYEEKYNGLKIGDYVTLIDIKANTYTTRIESFDKDGWIEGKLNEPSGGHYKYIHYRLATEEEIKKAQVPDITINGYKAEFFDDYVKFGCAEFDKHEFIFAQKFIQKVLDSKNYGSSKTNREVESITIGTGVFTKEQIKQIVEYYKNK